MTIINHSYSKNGGDKKGYEKRRKSVEETGAAKRI